MRALVTGSAGFLGRHFVNELERRGYHVTGIDIRNGDQPDDDAINFFRYGVLQYDLAVHCAASAPHRLAIDTQHQHMPYNVMLDSAFFNWAVATHQPRVLYVSSSAVYPINRQDMRTSRPLREIMCDISSGSNFLPDGPYGWTKVIGEQMANEARKCGVQVTVVRPFSGYGVHQSDDFPFRAILNRAHAREDPLRIWGSGQQVRDWIHVRDVVNGTLAVVERNTVLPVNIGTGEGTSMRELARRMAVAIGYEPEIVGDDNMPAGVLNRVADVSRFFRIYTPTMTLNDGIQEAIRGE